MGVGIEALERFLDAAKRLAEACGLQHVEAGLVSLGERDQAIALQLRARLVRKLSQRKDPFRAVGIRALWATGPLSALDDLVRQIAAGRVDTLIGEKLDPPIAEALLAGTQWSLHENYSIEGVGRCLRAACSLSVGRVALDPDIVRQIDRLIAKASDHKIASLARLGLIYAGKPIEAGRGGEIELLAPWPISAVGAKRHGRALRLQLEGLEGLDPKRFIVNVEGKDRDRRFDSSAIEWATGPSDTAGGATYVGTIEDPGPTPVAVNVYFAGIDEVAMRENVRDDASFGYLGLGAETGVTVPRAREVVEGTRVSSLHAEFFRCLRAVDLDLTPLTVVVGENQAGKSTLLEALDVLGCAARGDLYGALASRRGGLRQVIWRGVESPGHVGLGATVRVPDGREFKYQMRIGPIGSTDWAVELEQLHERVRDDWHLVVEANHGVMRVGGREERARDPRELMLCQVREPLQEMELVRSALASIAVFPFFQTGAAWADAPTPTRQAARVEPAARLTRTAANLSAALHAMSTARKRDWEEFLEIVRMVFPRLQDIAFPSPYAGSLILNWYEKGVERAFDVSELSDGTVALLASLCALFEPEHALVAMDEPERHLHPEALYRVVSFARVQSGKRNVLLATQSDRLLSFLDETPESVVIARRGEKGTELVRPEPEHLGEWLKKFSLSEIRPELESWGQGA